MDREGIQRKRIQVSLIFKPFGVASETNPLFVLSPRTPEVKPVGDNYVVIYMACNDSPHIIKSIMEEKEYHERCRACMGNPRTMVELEPAWFRVGIKNLPCLP